MESAIAIADYVRFFDKDRTPVVGYAFQNMFVSQTRTFGGVQYIYAPIGFDGDISMRAGENPQATLISVQNALSYSMMVEAVTNRYLVTINKVAIDIIAGSPPTFNELGSLGINRFIATAMDYDSDGETINLRLNGPRNAVDKQAVSGRLTSNKVGALPATGNIQTS